MNIASLARAAVLILATIVLTACEKTIKEAKAPDAAVATVAVPPAQAAAAL